MSALSQLRPRRAGSLGPPTRPEPGLSGGLGDHDARSQSIVFVRQLGDRLTCAGWGEKLVRGEGFEPSASRSRTGVMPSPLVSCGGRKVPPVLELDLLRVLL